MLRVSAKLHRPFSLAFWLGEDRVPCWGNMADMAREDDNRTSGGVRRDWNRGDRSKVSIMHIFRSAFEEEDARKARRVTETGEGEITKRSMQRREGMSVDALKRHLESDLTDLMNTVNLGAAVDLEDAPHVARSVLNYGFRDLSDVTARDLNDHDVVKSLRQSLLDHEPRIIPETLEVTVSDRGTENTRNRLMIHITADLMGDPVDVPVEFDAEVDLGVGKLKMSNLRVQP